jgi:hypothetical protein
MMIIRGGGGDNRLKNKKYHTVGTIPKSNIKIVEIYF